MTKLKYCAGSYIGANQKAVNHRQGPDKTLVIVLDNEIINIYTA